LSASSPPFQEFAITADEIVGGDGFAFAPTAATTWASCDGSRTAPAGVHELFQLEYRSVADLWQLVVNRIAAASQAPRAESKHHP